MSLSRTVSISDRLRVAGQYVHNRLTGRPTAVTIEMYAKRKGWEIGEVEVDVDYEPAQKGSPTKFKMAVRLPKELPEEQGERLMQIAAKCPVHRALEGEVMFDETLELT